MKRYALLTIALLAVGYQHPLAASVLPNPQEPVHEALSTTRIGIAGGMGVEYFNASDIVDRIAGLTGTRNSDFVGAAEFFGAVIVPMGKRWTAKLEYSYLIAGYNVQTGFPGSDFSVSVHMPTVIAQYVLADAGTYNVKAGAGIGYHFGSYTERYGTIDAVYTGSGPGFKLDLEANTAFGDNLFAYLGADLRWDAIGELSDDITPTGAIPPALDFFSVGAKLGFIYYL
jgi:hypothetical protein